MKYLCIMYETSNKYVNTNLILIDEPVHGTFAMNWKQIPQLF